MRLGIKSFGGHRTGDGRTGGGEMGETRDIKSA